MASKGRPYRTIDVEGWEVLVGRSDEAMTTYLCCAHPLDAWLHVAGGTPGSHVVVRNPENGEVPREVIQRAADSPPGTRRRVEHPASRSTSVAPPMSPSHGEHPRDSCISRAYRASTSRLRRRGVRRNHLLHPGSRTFRRQRSARAVLHSAVPRRSRGPGEHGIPSRNEGRDQHVHRPGCGWLRATRREPGARACRPSVPLCGLRRVGRRGWPGRLSGRRMRQELIFACRSAGTARRAATQQEDSAAPDDEIADKGSEPGVVCAPATR